MTEFIRIPLPVGVNPVPCPVCGHKAGLFQQQHIPGGPASKAVCCDNPTFAREGELCLLNLPPEEFWQATVREAVAFWDRHAHWCVAQRLTVPQTGTSVLPPAPHTMGDVPLYPASMVRQLIAEARVPQVGAAPITVSIMRDDGGEAPAYCLMAAFRSEEDARAALWAIEGASPVAPKVAAPRVESWGDLPKKLMEAARRDALTQADRVAIGCAIARIQKAARAAAPEVAAPAKLSIPDGWRLVKQSRLDEIVRLSVDPSVACYQGRGLYDERAVRENWSACTSRLEDIRYETECIRDGSDDEELPNAERAAQAACTGGAKA